MCNFGYNGRFTDVHKTEYYRTSQIVTEPNSTETNAKVQSITQFHEKLQNLTLHKFT